MADETHPSGLRADDVNTTRQTETVRNLVAALLRTLRPTVASLAMALVGSSRSHRSWP
jgi:hypothetical protein